VIPNSMIHYLERNQIPFTRRFHRRAVTAPELAAALHEHGYQVAKAVLLEVDRKRWVAVLPATELVDANRVARALNAREVRLLDEDEFVELFPDCEAGAEPPFGGLYGLPVIAGETLAEQRRVWMRAGSHEECVSMSWSDFDRLEHPIIASIGEPIIQPRASAPTVVGA
jgi:Ala-tRNA(Pro) deacylase